MRYPEQPILAVGTVVLRDDRILLVRRAKAPSAGLWAVPGGRVELGETLQQAAERELLEETGVVVHAEKPIYAFDAIERDAAGRVLFHYAVVDLLATYVSGQPRAMDDAAEARWMAARELEQSATSAVTVDLLRKIGFLGESGAACVSGQKPWESL